MTTTNTTKLYGLTAVPADQSKQEPATSTPGPLDISALQVPQTALATRVAAYAESKLDADTYRHSLRVYSYGCAIARRCFPEFELAQGSKLEETWFLTAMLHDIGTSPEFLTATRLSFEFWGGYHALRILQDGSVTGSGSDGHGEGRGEGEGEGEGVAPREQAESVAEAIIRHQDLQDKGSITLITRLIHLGTLLDNVGAGAELVNRQTIENVVREYPRPGWSSCFKSTVEREKSVKPYAMVSRIEGFEGMIEKNGQEGGVMGDFD
jgi:cyanamide hydratase